jgi:hypothetical protein
MGHTLASEQCQANNLYFFFFFWQYWGLNSGLCACWADTYILSHTSSPALFFKGIKLNLSQPHCYQLHESISVRIMPAILCQVLGIYGFLASALSSYYYPQCLHDPHISGVRDKH